MAKQDNKADQKRRQQAAADAMAWLNERGDRLSEWCHEGGIDAITLIRVGTKVVMREEKFQSADVWPSLYLALITAAQLGLEPEGPLREAYLLPYWDKDQQGYRCQLQISYQGLIILMLRSGHITNIRSFVYHEHDDVGLEYTTSGTNWWFRPVMIGDRGEPAGVLSVASLSSGGVDIEMAPWSEVEKARRAAGSNSPAWKTWPEQMAKKFIIKRHSNQLPLSPVAKQAVIIDNSNPDELAHTTQRILDVDVIEELPPAPAAKSKTESPLSRKARERKEKARTKKSSPPPNGEARAEPTEEPSQVSKEPEIEMLCTFCGENPVTDVATPCDMCQDEARAAERDAG